MNFYFVSKYFFILRGLSRRTTCLRGLSPRTYYEFCLIETRLDFFSSAHIIMTDDRFRVVLSRAISLVAYCKARTRSATFVHKSIYSKYRSSFLFSDVRFCYSRVFSIPVVFIFAHFESSRPQLICICVCAVTHFSNVCASSLIFRMCAPSLILVCTSSDESLRAVTHFECAPSLILGFCARSLILVCASSDLRAVTHFSLHVATHFSNPRAPSLISNVRRHSFQSVRFFAPSLILVSAPSVLRAVTHFGLFAFSYARRHSF